MMNIININSQLNQNANIKLTVKLKHSLFDGHL